MPVPIQQRQLSGEIACPHCDGPIRFYAYSGMSDLAPHFYCDACSNVFHRRADAALLRTETPSSDLVAHLAATLPACPCGGQFRPDVNPKCPHCYHEMDHQADAIARLADENAVVVEGAYLIVDD